ncbi:MAG: UDP-N-acetylglucosamine--N-acetylmuramyl-(pentapeptide) pyrophosphoryl-undecaprenol N-acetylglucosamine transferase [Planctomycetota bacterium]
MKVAFLGGGTGGHLAAGVAVAEELRRRGHDALFLIAGRQVEHAMLAPRGLHARELFGDRSRPGPLALPSWWSATARWRRAVRDYDPDAIVVLGGWVALPAVFTGFFGRPSVLIEQNARPGKVQRLLGQRVGWACLTVEGRGMPHGKRGTSVTGNPSPELERRERGPAAEALGLDPARRTLLLMGGSGGAADLNALLPALTAVLAARAEPWQVLNLTGGRAAPGLGEMPVPVVRRDFLDDMSAAYSVADVAVCRSGGCTVSELALTGTPSVLIPYPHHADRHQEANAERLVAAGGACIVERDDPTGRRTAADLLAGSLDRLDEMAAAARTVAQPGAAAAVADVVLAAMEESR